LNSFEYIIILTSLILGLGVSQILVGVANLITNKNIKWSLPHAMMTTLIFLTQIQEWWITYQYSMLVDGWTLTRVMMLMVYPILLFVAARILFPYSEIQNEAVDLGEYYAKSWPALFTIFFIVALTSIWQNYVFSGIPIANQILQILAAVGFLVFLVFKIKRRAVHVAFLSIHLVVWVGYVIQEDFVIGG